MAFTILFEGLICHVGPDADQKRHAALVSDKPTHAATFQLNGRTPIELFKGDRIVFSTGQGTATTTADFKNRVPSLQQLLPAGASIDPRVFGAIHDPADGALAFVIFPDGQLDAPEVAFRPLDFEGANGLFITKRCVAKGVRFAAAANASVSIMYGGSARETFALGDTDVIRIKNVSDGVEGHFDLYKLLTTSTRLGNAKADTTRRCKPEPDFDERDSLFTIKADALVEGALRRGEIIKLPPTSEGSEQRQAYARAEGSPDDPTSSQDPRDVLETLSAPHAECSNSNWP